MAIRKLCSGFVRGTMIAALLFAITEILTGCGGSSSAPQASAGAMNGNWQINLVQNYPHPVSQLSVSGFMTQSSSSLVGSFQIPALSLTSSSSPLCGGPGPLTGNLNGSNVAFAINAGGTTFSFIGTVSSNSMSGSYQALAGACLSTDSTGTWTASLIPALNGNFTGTLSGSPYMAALTGVNPPAPITVSGSFAQSSNAGASNASISGTITASGYPCFTNAYLSGTISGQNVYLGVYNYNGLQIGTLGVPGLPGVAGTPAIVATGSQGTTLSGTGQAGLSLGNTGASPCPALQQNGTSLANDTTDVAFTLQ